MSIYDNNLPTVNPRKIARGKYGAVYNDTGDQMTEVSEFEAKIKFDKKKIERANAFLDGNRIMGGSGTGKMKMYFTENTKALVRRILTNPDETFTLVGDLHDPDAETQGANHKVAIKGISFDEAALLAFKVKDLVEEDFPFTFDDFEIIE
ncbi:phage tail tube protein [Bacillus sp. FSL W8-0519]|uniref:phage tail tube protein n=1 Tax=Bacillus sp. FSL W8-0519 TaxID=2954624 RepID=UPI000937B8AF